MRQFILYTLSLLNVFQIALSQPIHIPDDQFREALHACGVDLDGNGTVGHEEAAQVTDLDLSGRLIQDLSGIEAFENLHVLNCDNNQIKELKLSSLTGLVSLSCRNNRLTCLDVSSLRSLEYLYCGGNNLVGLDISNNHWLGFGDTSLIALDIENMPFLRQVCHWWGMFYSHHPKVSDKGSPNVVYTTICGPEVFSVDSTAENGSLQVMASKDGIVFLVPGAVPPVLAQVQEASLRSAMVKAYQQLALSIEGISPGQYLLYAADMSAKLSTPLELSITHEMAFNYEGDTINGLQQEKLGDLAIVPNPAGQFIRITGNCRQALQVTVFDTGGRMVCPEQLVFPGDMMDVSPFPPGLYIIKMRYRDFSVSKMLLIR